MITRILAHILAPLIRAELDRIIAAYGPDLIKRATESRKALDDAEQTARRAEHKADLLGCQVQDHENRLRVLEGDEQ